MLGNMLHTLTELDREALTAVCAVCGPTRVRRRAHGGDRAGFKYRCRNKILEEHGPERLRRRPKGSSKRRRHVRNRVSMSREAYPRCGFVFEDPCQQDLDHVVRVADGGTNTPDNWQLLCANCHRLKSALEMRGSLPADFLTRYPL